MARNITKLRHRFPKLRELITTIRQMPSAWPLLLLLAISAILSYLNYQPGTWLTGWDNLHPEFDFSTNLTNNLFSVWQERGTGFLVGMSPAADTLRVLFLSLVQKLGVTPAAIRYFWTFASLALGPIGVYFLLHHLFLKPKFDPKTKRIASFLGALFYLLNLATIQFFFIPFESFTAFYAALPFLLLAVSLFFEKPSPAHYLFLTIVLLSSSPAFFVQTLFVVLALCLLPIVASHLHHPKKRLLVFLLTLLATQSHWLLPQIFFVATRASEVSQAHANLLSSPETLYRNLEFANLQDLFLLKGFWFNILDASGDNKFDYLFLVWRNHLANPIVAGIGYLAFFLVATGIVYSLKKRLPFAKAFCAIFLICNFFLLGGALVVGQNIPLLGELFRSPFTKFSLPLALTYSLFFSVGVIFILDLFSFLHTRLTYYLTLFTVTVALIIYATPAFTGNLISPLMRVKIPPEYFELFTYFKGEDPATRIANFPQYVLWGWNYYSWGYRGAGFLWYGIRQPLLDRGFDVWEQSSEKYYEEITTAIYSENQMEFEALIDKYAINWILLDKNIIAADPNLDLGVAKLESLIKKSPRLSLAKNIADKIYIYQTNLDQKVKNFLSLSSPLPANQPFTNLSLRPFAPDIIGDSLNLGFQSSPNTQTLVLPALTQTESLLPTTISYRKIPAGLELKFSPILPEIKINQKTIPITPPTSILSFSLPENNSGLVIAINDQYLELALPDELTTQSTFYPLTNLYLPTRQTIRLSVYANTPSAKIDLTSLLAAATPTQCYTQKPNRKIEKIVAGKTISLLGTDLVGCLSAPVPPASPNQLLALDFVYQSATATPANANVTNPTFGGQNSPQPITPQKEPTFTRVFAKPPIEAPQVNLILEANETKSTQEISYRDVTLSYLPLLAEASYFPNSLPVTTHALEPNSKVTVSLPIVASPYTLSVSPTNQSLNPESRNCDNFNQGKVDRATTATGFLYTAKNANSCDQVNLRYFPHLTNYAILIDSLNQKGLSPTICLENHATRRCDVFERLINGPQAIIQPISNQSEPAGYTLHLFNQSFGNRETANLIKTITITPLPLNFLKAITLTTSSGITTNQPVADSHHPAEFLYTMTLTNPSDQLLNLSQTKSPYWIALEVSESDRQLPFWLLVAKLPYLYFFTQDQSAILRHADANLWHNAWQLPPGNHQLVIFYLPQYLEFIGFLLFPTPFIGCLVYFLLKRRL